MERLPTKEYDAYDKAALHEDTGILIRHAEQEIQDYQA